MSKKVCFLSDLLSHSGSSLTETAVEELLRGVAAAPEGYNPEGWHALIAKKPTAALCAALEKRLSTFRSLDYGLKTSPTPPSRVHLLREELQRLGLAGIIIPRGDEHQGEYVASRSERLAWISGLTASAGLGIVLMNAAAVFVDGRYILQAKTQINNNIFEQRHITKEPASDWIVENLPRGAKLGYDPWLLTSSQVAHYTAACKKVGGLFVALKENPIDAVWKEQAPPPLAPVWYLNDVFTGETSEKKLDRIAALLRTAGVNAALLTSPDSINWLLNVRGGDIPFTPLALSFAIIHSNASLDWFIDLRKLTPSIFEKIDENISLHAPNALGSALDDLGRTRKTVRIDSSSTPVWATNRLRNADATIDVGDDPCQLAKAKKNPIQMEGMRKAHLRDGVAVIKFLAWIDNEPVGPELTELRTVKKLEEFRSVNEYYRGPSFTTIAGSGPNGAIVHYSVTAETDRALGKGELFLFDSGGQYLDGTTDITRTIAIGDPTPKMCEHWTLVLKGHIALAEARFPPGTTGSQLDILARQSLWKQGLDYDHGTGHGVGSFLSVHEGPHRISKTADRVRLEPGMVVSNEPGLYLSNEYGIRIENLIAVIKFPRPNDAIYDVNGFETLTLAPFDRKLIDVSILNDKEISWVDKYHARVRNEVGPLLDPETQDWLARATASLRS